MEANPNGLPIQHHPNSNNPLNLHCRRKSGRREKQKKQISVKPERTMGPNVTCIMRWSRRNMTFIPTILILTSIKPGWLPPLPEYVSAMNVYPCASSSTSTRYTPTRKTVVSLREKHRSRLS